MNIRKLRELTGISRKEFSQKYQIPITTLQKWELGYRIPPAYVINLLEQQIKRDFSYKKRVILPKYDPSKKDLPKRRDYIGSVSWLKAVQTDLPSQAIFALDEALMCDGSFGGRSDEFLVWVYGDESLSNYNGIVILGEKVDSNDIEEKNGLKYTKFNRTIYDAICNESVLDMQGTVEALSKYYFMNNGFDQIFIPPQYDIRFQQLSKEAMEYYDS